MFDINTVLSAALSAAITEATKPLLERIATLESANDILHKTQHEDMVAMRDRITALEGDISHKVQVQQADIVAALAERVAALETKLTEAALFAQTNNVTIPIDEAKMVEALNSQEWFWEKLQNRIDAATEQAVDDHCSTYDHDDYDSAVSKLDDMPDLDDYVTRDEVRSEIEDVLNNATLSLSI